jgi:hypothetical protein
MTAAAIANTPVVVALRERLAVHRVAWAVAGGWALDLFLGEQTRLHADVDIAVWRDQSSDLRAALADWTLLVAEDGSLRQWLPDDVHQIGLHELHALGPGDQRIELLLNERDQHDWIYRRDAGVRLPLNSAIHAYGAMSSLAPEIALLYKSKSPRSTDDQDFAHVAPRLTPEARKWLHKAIVRANDRHPWLLRLDAPEA